MHRRTRAALLAALTLGPLAGCAEDKDQPAAGGSPSASPSTTASPVVPGPPWHDEVAAAPAGVPVGGKGTPCALPVTFSLPAGWKVKAVKPSAEGGDLGVGNATLLCELDSRPAGELGFLRVWRVDGVAGGAEEHLKHFVGAYSPKATGVEYRRLRAGTLDAVEASYTEDGDPDRAIALASLYGPIVLSLDAPDPADLLPAYQLVKQSARINRD
ncbi:lipoprotein [Micromonospora sp. C28SCA-DRY-2]|uniref:lipoprotein n=1 Tax=Micromonospora sp. C28SCA-DRY-2 TaxID=3059522 RepID=UPI002674F29A|nr:lipoprotein [Micromonospora sp. C28SCA-DRY-2]MDO3701826.1 lipoprotein [Micromonospora sp. C28SCA-DRY-2]